MKQTCIYVHLSADFCAFSCFLHQDRILSHIFLQTHCLSSICGFKVKRFLAELIFFFKSRSYKMRTALEAIRGRLSTAKRGTCKHMNPAQDLVVVTSKPLPDTKTVSNVTPRVKVNSLATARFLPHIPHSAHNRRCIVAALPPYRGIARSEMRRYTRAPRCD